MKKIIYLTVLLISGNVSAQICNQTILPHAEVGGVGNIHIMNDTTITDLSGSNYYICSGVTVIMNGSTGCNYQLEQGASLTINQHDGDNVVAKGNCTIIDNDVTSIVVSTESSTTVSKPNGPGALVLFTCPSVVFDYAQIGGSSPCSVGINEISVLEESFLVSPNPISHSGILNLGMEVSNIQIFDLTGRLVADYQNLNSTSITLDLQEGIFFVKAVSVSGKLYSTRLIAE